MSKIPSPQPESSHPSSTKESNPQVATTVASLDDSADDPVTTSFFCSCKTDADRQYGLILIISIIYYLSLSIAAIPLILLMNQRIAGDAEHPTSESAFVVSTTKFLHSFISFLFGRYTAGLSDYLGRKPLLFIGVFLTFISLVIYLQSDSPGGFYIASIIGAPFSCFYFVILALISDLYPLYSKRSKRVGIFTGSVGGFAFVVGVPLGSALGTHASPVVPIRLSILLCFLTMILIILFPFHDTIAVEALSPHEKTLISYFGQHRSVPANWKHYLITYFPIYFDSHSLITNTTTATEAAATTAASGSPTSGVTPPSISPSPSHLNSFFYMWWVNFFMHCLSSLMYLIFIQYTLAVFNWSPALASGSVLFIGISLGILSPTLLHHYHPVALSFYLMSIFILGIFFLSIAGTGISEFNSLVLGLCGVFCIGIGCSWSPSLHAIILSEYPLEIQGKINGLLSQQNDASVLPAYIMSLGFSLSLHKKRGEDETYWPGSAFGAATVIGLLAILCHVYLYGFSQSSRIISRKDQQKEDHLYLQTGTTETNNISSEDIEPPL